MREGLSLAVFLLCFRQFLAARRRVLQLSGCAGALLVAAGRHAEAQTPSADEFPDAIRALREELAVAASASADASSARFESALEGALDKITRTMESATARPIEISVEATDVLLDKISEGGLDSLSNEEKRRLNELSKRLR